jgi:CheY-like chemotaxis protein
MSGWTRPHVAQQVRRTILVVDDDPMLRHYLAELLEGEGYVVHQASDGEAGLQLYREHRPDLVLTDIVMPNREGIELILTLGAGEPRKPIVAMSGGGALQACEDYLNMARLLGADAVLQKPFPAQQLLQTITDLLRPR